jgi:hypothetical protein
MLQIHGPSDCLTAEDVSAYMNGDFAVLDFGPIHFYIDDPEQCEWLIAAAVEAKRLLAPPEPPAHVCECGHFEAYHVGAVLGDPDPGQCTDDDCACERFRPAAGKDEPASPDAAEALIGAIVAGTPAKAAS